MSTRPSSVSLPSEIRTLTIQPPDRETGPVATPVTARKAPIQPQRLGISDFLTFVLWGALAGALGELAARYVLLAIRPTLIATFYLNEDSIWLGPLVNLPVFLILVGAVFLVVRRWQPRLLFASLVFITTALVLFEVAQITARVHVGALALFAAGAASVISGVASRFPAISLGLVRITAVIMGLCAVGGGVARTALSASRERQSIAALPAAAAGAPNIVLLILDTIRANELGSYGNPRSVSPHIDSLVQNGVRFEHAFSTAPWTLTSHTSMLTGHYPHELSAGWTYMYDGKYPLISDALQKKGYVTGGFVGNLVFLTKRWGLSRGFIHYEDYASDLSAFSSASTLTRLLVTWWNDVSPDQIPINRTPASVIRKHFAHWQAGLGDRPFFAFINLFDAHAPYHAPEPFDTLFLGRRVRFRDIDNFRQRDSIENFELRAGYDQAMAALDEQVGALLADLRARGVLQRTFFILTSDLGEEFGEHGFSGHGGGLQATQTHVPLIVVPPAWRGARDVSEFVTLRDIAATIADVADVPSGAVPGRTLRPYWVPSDTLDARGEPSPILSEVRKGPRLRSWYPLYHGTLRSIIAGRLHYIAQDGDRELLYDIVADPLEAHDLSRQPAFADSLPRLRTALAEAFRPRTN